MSKSILAAIMLAAVVLPEGIEAGALEVTLYSADPSLPQPVTAAEAINGAVTFNDVPPGDYYATAARLDSQGNVLGETVTSAVITVPAVELATYDAPTSITLSLG